VHHFLKLDLPPAILLRKFHKKAVRVLILKAIRNNFLLRTAETEKDVLEFYRIYHTARRRIGLPSIPYAFFRNLWDVFHPSGRMQVIMGVLDHQVAGASILLKFKDWVHIEYGHDLFEYRKLCVNQFLDWEAIKLACRENFNFVSFGRTALNNTGLISYKDHWGTTAERLLTHYYPEGGGVADKAKEASWQYRFTRQLCARSPLPIYNLISAFVYRHLG
jgi:lipid II:glycine glycyltransferase (peptidoglycan interpeptide bridge formation enzyme)